MRKFLYTMLGLTVIGLLVWGFTFVLKQITKSGNAASWTIGTWVILIVAVVVTIAMIVVTGILWDKALSSSPPPPPPPVPPRSGRIGVWVGRIIGVVILIAGIVFFVKFRDRLYSSYRSYTNTTWVYNWHKDVNVGGENPAQRSGGPFGVKFRENDQDTIILDVYNKGKRAACIKLWRSGESGWQWIGRYDEFVYRESAKARFDQKPDGSLVGEISTKDGQWIDVEITKR